MKKIKKLLTVILAAILIIGCLPLCSAFAETEGIFEYFIFQDEAYLTGLTTEVEGEVIIPNTLGGKPVVRINDWAFENGKKVTSIVLPNTLTTIYRNSLNATSITSITIPASVENIYCTFAYCLSLESIEVDDANPYFSAVDGILFNKDKTELIQYPAAKTGVSYTVPSGVKTLHSTAFVYNQHIQEIILPDTLATIHSEALLHCTSLKKIVIPYSVVELQDSGLGFGIDENDYGNYYKLSDIVIHCYAGTAAEQHAYEYGFNTVILNKQGDLNCNDDIDAEDALVALKLVVNKVVATPGLTEIADVNGDGSVTAADALEILKKTVGKNSCF